MKNFDKMMKWLSCFALLLGSAVFAAIGILMREDFNDIFVVVCGGMSLFLFILSIEVLEVSYGTKRDNAI